MIFKALFGMVMLVMLAVSVLAQETVTIPIEDLKQLRKIAADRDYQQSRADEAARQADAWKLSSANWQALYLAEKDRADRVQGGRVDELQKAIAAYKDQAENDRQRLGELDYKVRKLRSERKWWFALGFGTGAVTGGYAVKKFDF